MVGHFQHTATVTETIKATTERIWLVCMMIELPNTSKCFSKVQI